MNMKSRDIGRLASALSSRHLKFANLVLSGMDQTSAYAEAGYVVNNKSTACKKAYLLLNRDGVRAYMEACQQEAGEKASESLNISKERIMGELARMGFANAKNYVDEHGVLIPIQDLSFDEAAAITEITQSSMKKRGSDEKAEVIETRVKLADKKSCLELLGKTQGIDMFSNKVKVEAESPLAFILKTIGEEAEEASPLPSDNQ